MLREPQHFADCPSFIHLLVSLASVSLRNCHKFHTYVVSITSLASHPVTFFLKIQPVTRKEHVLASSCTWTRAIRTWIVLQGTYSMLRPPSYLVISLMGDPKHTGLSVLQCCHSCLHWFQCTADSAPRLTKLPSPFILSDTSVQPFSAPSPAVLPSCAAWLTPVCLRGSLFMTCFLLISLPVLFWPLPLSTAFSWRLTASTLWAQLFILYYGQRLFLEIMAQIWQEDMFMSQPGCHGISDSLRTQESSQENYKTLQLK